MDNCKCDYCGFHDPSTTAGNSCHKCGRGVMCACGSRGWGKVDLSVLNLKDINEVVL